MKNYETVKITLFGGEYTAIQYVPSGEFLINLCPHAVDILVDGEKVTVPPSGQTARCAQTTARTGRTFAGIPVSRSEYGKVTGLPKPFKGVGYIVSMAVKNRLPDRTDVFQPSETVRNEAGQVAGAASLGE